MSVDIFKGHFGDILYFLAVNEAYEKAKSDSVFVHISILYNVLALSVGLNSKTINMD